MNSLKGSGVEAFVEQLLQQFAHPLQNGIKRSIESTRHWAMDQVRVLYRDRF